MEWQPIETIPRNKTVVVCCDEKKRFCFAEVFGGSICPVEVQSYDFVDIAFDPSFWLEIPQEFYK